jgi:hypothetical protein
MYTNSLVHLSRLIDAALEAVAIPALLMLAATIVTVAAVEIRDRVRRGQPRARGRIGPDRYSEILSR